MLDTYRLGLRDKFKPFFYIYTRIRREIENEMSGSSHGPLAFPKRNATRPRRRVRSGPAREMGALAQRDARRRTGGSRAGQLRLTSIELVDRAHVDVGARACLPGTELWEDDATRLSTDPLKRKRSTKPDQSSAWILHVCLSMPSIQDAPSIYTYKAAPLVRSFPFHMDWKRFLTYYISKHTQSSSIHMNWGFKRTCPNVLERRLYPRFSSNVFQRCESNLGIGR
jgi:hypothetical protein